MNSRALSHLNDSILARTAFAPYGFNRGMPTPTHLNNFIANVQFERLAHDIMMWRDAIREMELAFYPQRIKANRMYIDTVLNGTVAAILERWRELTLQRDYIVYQQKGEEKVKSVDLTQALEEQSWFSDYLYYALDSLLWGYSLISLGDIVDDKFPNIEIIRRENIRPDGIGADRSPILTSLVYAVDGIHVTDDPLIDMCNHWIPTKNDRGVSPVGYGLLYKIALYEIHLRHTLEWNMDFAESFGMPIKKGFTNKTGKDRKQFEAFLQNSASNAYILLDKATGDDVVFEFAKSIGTAWKVYENLDQKLEGVIAKLVLGHTDGMNSSPDKLGGNQKSNKDGDNINLVQAAMNAKQITAGNHVIRAVNEIFAPKMRRLGAFVGSKTIENLIPKGYTFGLMNDTEENEIKNRTNNHRVQISTYVQNLNDAGWDIADADSLSKELGIKVKPATPEHILRQFRETTTTTTNIDGDVGKAKPPKTKTEE